MTNCEKDAKYSRIELHESTVIKHFNDPEAFEREMAVYELALPMTPALLDYIKPDRIVLARCKGSPYLDHSLGEEAIAGLAETIAQFHKRTLAVGICLCHWDNQPRNILYDGKSFVLLDFAESRTAKPEDDITHLLLFWAAEFTQARMETLSRAFVVAYRQVSLLSSEHWPGALRRSIERFDLRRSLFCHSAPHLSPAEIETNRHLISQLVNPL